MDDLIIWLIQKHGWGALVLGVLAYLLIEGGLDIVTDLISNYLINKKKKRNKRK